MRSPNALCFAVSHMGDEHKHLHFCFSGTEYKSKTTLRMDDKTFRNLREGMEHYQKEFFPELKNSLVYLGKQQKKKRFKARAENRAKAKEYQAKKRLGKAPTEKEHLSTLLTQAYNNSRGINQFYNSLSKAGVSLYERNGKVTGVLGKRKYRFKTLGVTPEMLQSLDRFSKRQRDAHLLTGRDEGDGRER